MTPYQSEELENIGRQAKKGKAMMERLLHELNAERALGSRTLDVFLSILDQVERIKNDNKAQDSIAGH